MRDQSFREAACILDRLADGVASNIAADQEAKGSLYWQNVGFEAGLRDGSAKLRKLSLEKSPAANEPGGSVFKAFEFVARELDSILENGRRHMSDAYAYDVEGERIAFEKWANEQHSVRAWGSSPLARNDRGVDYRNTIIQSAWTGWIARAKGKTP